MLFEDQCPDGRGLMYTIGESLAVGIFEKGAIKEILSYFDEHGKCEIHHETQQSSTGG